MDTTTLLDPRTVLVVEDDPLVRAILLRILRFNGYSAMEAHDGPRAVALFDEHADTIPLVLMDVNMPGRDGIDVATELRSKKPGLSVIYISGDVEHGQIGLERGEGFLHKPFAPVELAKLVASTIGASAQA